MPVAQTVFSSDGPRVIHLLFALWWLTAIAQGAPVETPGDPASAENSAVQARQGRRGAPGLEGIYKARVVPHWFANDTLLWYRNDLRGGAREFILVDTEKGTRQLAFDHIKLAAALSKSSGQEFQADHLPFSEIEFVKDGKALKFEAVDKAWVCDLGTYECSSASPAAENKPAPAATEPKPGGSPFSVEQGLGPPAETQRTNEAQQAGSEPEPPARGRLSPDGKWTAFVKENEIYLRSEADRQERRLTQDGAETNAYGQLEWAPDSATLIAWRIEPGDRKLVYLIRSSPPGGGRATMQSRPYPLPGDKFSQYELNLFDVASGKQLKPPVDRFEHEWERPRLHWTRDGTHFTYSQVERGHQRLRVIDVEARTGAVRNVIDEKTQTFIWTAHTENLRLELVNWLEKTDEIIYASESDGWRHLYLYDVKEARLKKQITNGGWVVRGIDRIDEEQRQVRFLASGVNPDQDPYFIQYYRVNFDGTGLVALTASNGTHSVQFSPTRKFLIDAYSRVDQPPVNELRRAADGQLVCPLEEADIADLKTNNWATPEVFVAKGRDGKTDIWGIICRPHDFDPARKYPVIECIYAGPQDSFVPKSFGASRRYSAFTDLGCVVVQIDGMGTANRSKAFHDVCWHNLKDAGFPDRILWHQAAAKKYSWYDITRVGIYGTSAGGQNAAGALLFHPEFYHAAVANSGCHDNRMDKASWNEQWMGYPVGPQYAECSNIENAGKLKGHLFLIMGEMDDNVPPESTLRFVDALIRADKDFDLLVVPNGRHGAGGAYAQRRMQDFFSRHLLGIEPANHNAQGSGG
ncbi:MAG TPA: DPP IV N-terminal domain-containing protein [Verrucomicrobiae bacterium]